LLSGIKDSDNVAINLKLKKGISDFSGTADIGAGFREAYKLKSTLLGISKFYKGFATVQYNNVGENTSQYDFIGNKLSIQSHYDTKYLTSNLISDGTIK